MSKLKLTASDIDACMSGPEVGPVDAGMIAEQALAAIELEAALAAAEAKLVSERAHSDALAGLAKDSVADADTCMPEGMKAAYAKAALAVRSHAARRAAEVAE